MANVTASAPAMGQIIITGASDDLIEIEGTIREEFSYSENSDGDLLAFSDGTILRVRYTDAGVWRITPVVNGTSPLAIEQAPEDDESNYSDQAVLAGAKWVVHGIAYASEVQR